MNYKDRKQLSEELQKLNEIDWGITTGISLVVIIIVTVIYLIYKEKKDRKEALRIAYNIAPKIKQEVDKSQKYVVPRLFTIGTKLYNEIGGKGYKYLYDLLHVYGYSNVDLLKNRSNYKLTGYIREIVYDLFKGNRINEGYFTGTASPFKLDVFLDSFEQKIDELRNTQGSLPDKIENILKSYTLIGLYNKLQELVENADEQSIDLLTKLVNVIVDEVDKVFERQNKG